MNTVFHSSIHLKNALWMLFSVFLLSYFIYHMVEGQRGVFVLKNINQEIQKKEQELVILKEKREKLDYVAVALRAETIDPDVLDEHVRLKLGYIRGEEAIILDH